MRGGGGGWPVTLLIDPRVGIEASITQHLSVKVGEKDYPLGTAYRIVMNKSAPGTYTITITP